MGTAVAAAASVPAAFQRHREVKKDRLEDKPEEERERRARMPKKVTQVAEWMKRQSEEPEPEEETDSGMDEGGTDEQEVEEPTNGAVTGKKRRLSLTAE